MIPEFPKFKILQLSDQPEVEKFTSQYPPYSDFNFVSMWSWDIKGETKLSVLNGNLVVRFTDYISGRPFYSFVGKNRLNDTVERLLEFAVGEGLDAELKLVPGEVARELDISKFKITEDRDSFDYILPAGILAEAKSANSLVERKKREVKSLKKNHVLSVTLLDMTREEDRMKVFKFIEQSIEDKRTREREFLAMVRFMEVSRNSNCLKMGVFVDFKLAGFCFSEVLKDGFANFHFWKADIKNYKQMYSFILQAKAGLLSDKYFCEFINIEQDLGLENLRKWKSGFGSELFLKKFTIRML